MMNRKTTDKKRFFLSNTLAIEFSLIYNFPMDLLFVFTLIGGCIVDK